MLGLKPTVELSSGFLALQLFCLIPQDQKAVVDLLCGYVVTVDLDLISVRLKGAHSIELERFHVELLKVFTIDWQSCLWFQFNSKLNSNESHNL